VTLRTRLILAVLVLTLLTLGGAFSAISVSVNRLQEQQLDDALLVEARREARLLASLADDALALSNLPGPAANSVGPLPTFVALRDRGGRRVAETQSLSGRALPDDGGRLWVAFDHWLGATHLRCVWVEVPSPRGGRLFFAVPRADLDGDAAFLSRAMVQVFLVAVVWAALVATWIVRRFTDEHRRIADVARRVADGDLSARILSRSSDRDTVQFATDLDAMIDRLGVLVASQRRFIAYAAHELRSPLTTLYGELSHALRKERSAVDYRASIEEALVSTRRLKQLAEDLLELARVSEASSAPGEVFSVADVIDRALASTRPLADARTVAVRCARWDGRIVGHPRDLERMLGNLIENAINHSPPESEVTVAVLERTDALEFCVSDRGEGVPLDERERIFEPFYRGATARERDIAGAGLGLAIARDIARSHGGSLTVTDAPGGGARFIATIRRVRPSEDTQ
jgi:two-component system heavy metal sensor histidine kinase CusS